MRLPAPWLRDAAQERLRLTSSRSQTAVAFALYGVLSIAYFGLPVLPRFGHDCICIPGDADVQMWFLVWWKHALLHGQNPFLTDAVFAPDRVNLGALTLAPGVLIAALPLTALVGPIASYNLLALASPPLAALGAFLLCRYVTRSFTAALFGGYVFGFSSYMLGHMLGHLTLVLTFPIPAAVLLTLKLIDGNIGRLRFIVLMAASLGVLFLFSSEVTFTFVVVGALVLALGFVLAPSVRPRLKAAVPLVLGAGALSALVTAPFIYYALTGDVTKGFFYRMSDTFVSDAVGFVVPNAVTRFGRAWFASVASTFTGNLPEDGVYLGLPLILIVSRYSITRWARPSTRVIVAALAVVVTLMLGDHLHIAGHPTIAMPWKLLSRIPPVDEVLPVRLGVYMFLLVAIVLALWLADAADLRTRRLKLMAAAIAVVMLLPNVTSGRWHNHENSVSFFATGEYRRYLHPGETVLALPWGPHGTSMLWQAEAQMNFRLAGGYLGALLPADYRGEPIQAAFNDAGVTPRPADLSGFLIRHRVGAIAVDAAHPQQWPAALAALGLKAVPTGGVLFYRLPPLDSGRWRGAGYGARMNAESAPWRGGRARPQTRLARRVRV
jgi:hypothetical protein